MDSLADAMALYAAPLLGEQALVGLAQAQRQRLARRHMRLVQEGGQRLLAQGQASAAAQLFERALPLHPQAEPLYRGLMAAQLQAGERALVLHTYAACEAALRASQGLAPSAATQALADAARRQG